MLRDFTPKSLFGRTILIVVLPLFVMQAAVTWVFFNRHWEEVTATLAESVANDLGLLVLEWNTNPDIEARAGLLTAAREELGIKMSFVPYASLPEAIQQRHPVFNALNRSYDRALDWSLDFPYWFDTQSDPKSVETRVLLNDGVLVFSVDRARIISRNGPYFVLWLIGATFLLGYVALIFLRNQVRSITRLAAAADAFGRGEDVRGFKPAGAREVRQAGHAFLAMRARIRRFLEQRTEMLAGVSHDLKTPLTRMKLNLALRPETDENDELRDDIVEMEQLLEDYLTFARGESETLRETIDLPELAEELVRKAERHNRSMAVHVEPNLGLSAQRSSLVRALSNLIENAFKYAEEVELSIKSSGQDVDFVVDDNGPGIPAEQRDAAVKAFGRLDSARNSNLAGSGLGLAVVRDVARAHGGAFRLEDSPLGGLRAILSLPAHPDESA
ncbi:MAG: ATP-binding protein [Parvularcula sp.]